MCKDCAADLARKPDPWSALAALADALEAERTEREQAESAETQYRRKNHRLMDEMEQARLEGWRAGRDAAAEHCYAKRDLLADAERKQIEVGLTGRDYYGRRLEAELLSRSIRALPEPKEASHD